jgi:hypothetical protein
MRRNKKGRNRAETESEAAETDIETKEMMHEKEDTIPIKIGEWKEMIKTIRIVFEDIKTVMRRLHLISKEDPEIKRKAEKIDINNNNVWKTLKETASQKGVRSRTGDKKRARSSKPVATQTTSPANGNRNNEKSKKRTRQ